MFEESLRGKWEGRSKPIGPKREGANGCVEMSPFPSRGCGVPWKVTVMLGRAIKFKEKGIEEMKEVMQIEVVSCSESAILCYFLSRYEGGISNLSIMIFAC